MSSEENILPYLVDSFIEGDCEVSQTENILDCLYSEIGEESNKVFETLKEAFKQTAQVCLLEIQKTNDEHGAIAEVLYRIQTDDYEDIAPVIDLEKIKQQAKNSPINIGKKVNRSRSNSNISDPGVISQDGGMRQRFTQEIIRKRGEEAQKVIGNRPEEINKVLESPVPSNVLNRLTSCFSRISAVAGPIGVKLAPYIYKLGKFVYGLSYFAASGFGGREDRILTNIEMRLFEKLETNSYELTKQFYTLAIEQIKSNARGRSLTAVENQTINEMTSLIGQREELHKNVVDNRKQSFLIQVLLRSVIQITRRILLIFIFSWFGSYVFDILGYLFYTVVFQGGDWAISTLISKIFGETSNALSLYNAFSSGVSSLTRIVLNFPFIPTGFRPGTQTTMTVSQSDDWNMWSVSGIIEGTQLLANKLVEIAKSIMLKSIGTLAIDIRDAIIQNTYKVLFLFPAFTNKVIIVTFLYCLIYYGVSFVSQDKGRWRAQNRWEREGQIREDILKLNREREQKSRANMSLRQQAENRARSGEYLDPISRGIFGLFGGKRGKRKTRSRNKRRKFYTRKH